MGFFDKIFGKKRENTSDQFREILWDASPKSPCGVCGKKLRGLSGGTLIGSGKQFAKTTLDGARLSCSNCGFISCYECSTDLKNKQFRPICKKCGGEMQNV